MKLAVSGCLLGEKIRFDGGHKHDSFIHEQLGKYVEFVSFCPEHLALGTPRPSMRLVEDDTLRVISNKDKSDITDLLEEKSRLEFERIEAASVDGIIFKSKSPSCGMGSAKLYYTNGFASGKGDGVFAAMCKAGFDLVPMEEEGRLLDPWLRENFMMQLFAYDALKRFLASNPAMSDLVQFHKVNKFMLQAKNEKLYRYLGNVVANREGKGMEEILQDYALHFKQAIAHKSSIKRNRNVLEHLSGFFKKELTASEKESLHEQIDEYAQKIVPLITPVSTILLYAKKYDTRYLLEQTFLNPYPKELALRSDIRSGK